MCRCRCSIRLVSVERMVVRKRGDERAGEEGEKPVSSAGQQSSLGKPLTEWDGRILTVFQRNEGRRFCQREAVVKTNNCAVPPSQPATAAKEEER